MDSRMGRCEARGGQGIGVLRMQVVASQAFVIRGELGGARAVVGLLYLIISTSTFVP